MGLGVKLDFNSRRAGIPSKYYKGVTFQQGVSLPVDGYLDQPMLAVLNYSFTLGDLTVGAASVPNAASIAALEYYNRVRSYNVSLSSFTANDVFKITIALAELYSLHSELVRDFKLNFKIDFENVAFNEEMNANIGFTSFNSDLSNIAARLNKAGNDLKKFPVLKGIPAFDDLLYVSSHIFADDQINKAGTIMFKKHRLLEYDTTATSSTVGCLKYTTLYAQSYVSKLALLENLIRQYAADEDVSRVCTEILKAEGLYTYPIELIDLSNLADCAKDLHRVFDWEIYDRLSNATIYPIKTSFATTTIAGIQEDTNGILLYGVNTVTNKGEGAMQASNYDNTSTNSNQIFRPAETDSWIFSHSEDPSEDAVVQFIAHHEHIYSENNASNRYFKGLSIIHIELGQLYYINSEAGNNITRLDFTSFPNASSDYKLDLDQYTNKTNAIFSRLRMLQLYNSFGCLPPIWFVVYDSSTTDYVRVYPCVRDIDNFANISDSTLINMKAMYTRGALFITPDDKGSQQSGRWNKGGSKNNKYSRGNKSKDKSDKPKDDKSTQEVK